MLRSTQRRRRALVLSHQASNGEPEAELEVPPVTGVFPPAEADAPELAAPEEFGAADTQSITAFESSYELVVESPPVELPVVAAVEESVVEESTVAIEPAPVLSQVTAKPIPEPVASAPSDEPVRGSATREERHAFLEACGVRGKLSIAVTRPNGSEAGTLPWKRPYVLIGTGPECDIQIARPEVGRRHAYLQVVAGKVFCADLGSQSGVIWRDGARRTGWLKAGNSVSIASYNLTLVQPRKAIAPPPKDASPTEPQLELCNGEKSLGTITLTHDVTLLGRNVCCNLQLLHSDVAEVHCSLVRTPTGVWIVDLSGNGCCLDGRVTPYGRLADDGELKIGTYSLRIKRPEAAAIETVVEPEAVEESMASEILDLAPAATDDVVEVPAAVEADPVTQALAAYVQQQQAAFSTLQNALLASLQQSGRATGPLADTVQQLIQLNQGFAQVSRQLSAAAAPENVPETPSEPPVPIDTRPFGQKPPSKKPAPAASKPSDEELRRRLAELEQVRRESPGWAKRLLRRGR